MIEITATALAYMESVKRYHNDQRFRAITQSVVHEAMREYIDRNPDADYREAHRLAEKVAAIMQERLFNEDAELTTQRQLADHYRKIAEDALALSPQAPFFVPAPQSAPQSKG